MESTAPTRPMPNITSAYDAQYVRARDGDTQVWRLSHHSEDTEIGWEEVLAGRLLEVDTAERRAPTRQEGERARDFVVLWLAARVDKSQQDRALREYKAWPFRVEKIKHDKYGGRYLVYVFFRPTGECLNDAIIEAGLSERIEPYEHMRALLGVAV